MQLIRYYTVMNNDKQYKQSGNDDSLLNAKEAGRRLGLSFWTLYAWARAGRIPYVQLGKRKLFDPRDIEAFIANNKVEISKGV